MAYLTLASLRDYVVVDQDRRRVDVYRRDGNGWQAGTLMDSGAFELGCLRLHLSLEAIYEGVEMPPAIAEAEPPA